MRPRGIMWRRNIARTTILEGRGRVGKEGVTPPILDFTLSQRQFWTNFHKWYTKIILVRIPRRICSERIEFGRKMGVMGVHRRQGNTAQSKQIYYCVRLHMCEKSMEKVYIWERSCFCVHACVCVSVHVRVFTWTFFYSPRKLASAWASRIIIVAHVLSLVFY